MNKIRVAALFAAMMLMLAGCAAAPHADGSFAIEGGSIPVPEVTPVPTKEPEATQPVAQVQAVGPVVYNPLCMPTAFEGSADFSSELYTLLGTAVRNGAEKVDVSSMTVTEAQFNTVRRYLVTRNPWGNIADITKGEGASIDIAYIDTRSDPSWKSNLDLLDYDLFIERVGSVLAEDDNGVPHLYVPHCFFIRNGQLVHDHSGTVPSQASPSDPLSEEELKKYRDIISGYVDDILR